MLLDIGVCSTRIADTDLVTVASASMVVVAFVVRRLVAASSGSLQRPRIPGPGGDVRPSWVVRRLCWAGGGPGRVGLLCCSRTLGCGCWGNCCRLMDRMYRVAWGAWVRALPPTLHALCWRLVQPPPSLRYARRRRLAHLQPSGQPAQAAYGFANSAFFLRGAHNRIEMK